MSDSIPLFQMAHTRLLCLAMSVMMFVMLHHPTDCVQEARQDAFGRALRRFNAFSGVSPIDRDCILLCHAECSLWKGYDLKHCGARCMRAGLSNFQLQYCFGES